MQNNLLFRATKIIKIRLIQKAIQIQKNKINLENSNSLLIMGSKFYLLNFFRSRFNSFLKVFCAGLDLFKAARFHLLYLQNRFKDMNRKSCLPPPVA